MQRAVADPHNIMPHLLHTRGPLLKYGLLVPDPDVSPLPVKIEPLQAGSEDPHFGVCSTFLCTKPGANLRAERSGAIPLRNGRRHPHFGLIITHARASPPPHGRLQANERNGSFGLEAIEGRDCQSQGEQRREVVAKRATFQGLTAAKSEGRRSRSGGRGADRKSDARPYLSPGGVSLFPEVSIHHRRMKPDGKRRTRTMSTFPMDGREQSVFRAHKDVCHLISSLDMHQQCHHLHDSAVLLPPPHHFPIFLFLLLPLSAAPPALLFCLTAAPSHLHILTSSH